MENKKSWITPSCSWTRYVPIFSCPYTNSKADFHDHRFIWHPICKSKNFNILTVFSQVTRTFLHRSFGAPIYVSVVNIHLMKNKPVSIVASNFIVNTICILSQIIWQITPTSLFQRHITVSWPTVRRSAFPEHAGTQERWLNGTTRLISISYWQGIIIHK